jgi:hypothetical protein
MRVLGGFEGARACCLALVRAAGSTAAQGRVQLTPVPTTSVVSDRSVANKRDVLTGSNRGDTPGGNRKERDGIGERWPCRPRRAKDAHR